MHLSVISTDRKIPGDLFLSANFLPETCESDVSYQKYIGNVLLRGENHIEGNPLILWSIGSLSLS